MSDHDLLVKMQKYLPVDTQDLHSRADRRARAEAAAIRGRAGRTRRPPAPGRRAGR